DYLRSSRSFSCAATPPRSEPSRGTRLEPRVFPSEVATGESGELVVALLPTLRELADLLRMVPCQVSGLRAVGREVEQLPRTVLPGGNELPVSHADRPVPFVLPPQVTVLHRVVAREDRHQA